MFDAEGREVPGNRGYKYFGAAKDLPGVRELFEQEPPPPARKTRAELMKDIDADYYGYRDDDDGILVPLEEKAERQAIQEAVTEWKATQAEKGIQIEDDDEDIYKEFKDANEEKPEEEENPLEKLGPKHAFTSHVPVPTQKDIEAALLKKRKLELMQRYGIEDTDEM